MGQIGKIIDGKFVPFADLGGGKTILTPNKAVVSGADGTVQASEVTAEEVGFLAGLTGNVQEQIQNIKFDIQNQFKTGSLLNGENIDDYLQSGMYWVNPNATGTKPYDDYGTLLIIGFLYGAEIQVFFPYSVINPAMWRVRANNMWGQWSGF